MSDTLATQGHHADERDTTPEVVAVEKHPRAIRWMHWFNFPILSVMIWSGLRIYWSFDYTRGPGRFGENTLIPNGVYEALDLDRKLARGLSFHFNFGWLFVLNGIAYVLYLAFSKEWKHIVPRLTDLKNIPATMLHDLGRRDEKPEQGQYNVMQQLAYTTVTVMGAIIVATGFAIYKPTQLWWLTTAFGGYETARAIHFLMTVGLVGFFGIHILQVIRAGFSNFWSMVTGYELEEVDPTADDLNSPNTTNVDAEEVTNV
jgi:thiosulfate reductase cytochrome b subunit